MFMYTIGQKDYKRCMLFELITTQAIIFIAFKQVHADSKTNIDSTSRETMHIYTEFFIEKHINSDQNVNMCDN